MMTYIVFGLLLAGILFWRIVLPGMKQVSGGETRIATSAGVKASASAPMTVASIKEWTGKYFWTILLVVVGIGLMIWTYNIRITAKEAGELAWSHWLALLLLWGLGHILITTIAKAMAVKGTMFHWMLVIAMFLLFILLLIVGWWNTPSTSNEQKMEKTTAECTKSRSCALPLGDDASDVIDVPEGKAACFEPWIWNHLDEVGLMISYQDPNSGKPFPCSREQVFGGSCTAVYDRFWFKPPRKTSLPKYWFVTSGSKQC